MIPAQMQPLGNNDARGIMVGNPAWLTVFYIVINMTAEYPCWHHKSLIKISLHGVKWASHFRIVQYIATVEDISLHILNLSRTKSSYECCPSCLFVGCGTWDRWLDNSNPARRHLQLLHASMGQTYLRRDYYNQDHRPCISLQIISQIHLIVGT